MKQLAVILAVSLLLLGACDADGFVSGLKSGLGDEPVPIIEWDLGSGAEDGLESEDVNQSDFSTGSGGSDPHLGYRVPDSVGRDAPKSYDLVDSILYIVSNGGIPHWWSKAGEGTMHHLWVHINEGQRWFEATERRDYLSSYRDDGVLYTDTPGYLWRIGSDNNVYFYVGDDDWNHFWVQLFKPKSPLVNYPLDWNYTYTAQDAGQFINTLIGIYENSRTGWYVTMENFGEWSEEVTTNLDGSSRYLFTPTIRRGRGGDIIVNSYDTMIEFDFGRLFMASLTNEVFVDYTVLFDYVLDTVSLLGWDNVHKTSLSLLEYIELLDSVGDIYQYIDHNGHFSGDPNGAYYIYRWKLDRGFLHVIFNGNDSYFQVIR